MKSITSLLLEHYPGMTEKALQKIESDARARWDLLDIRIIHRVGLLKPQDQIVFVGTASAHRVAAFESASFIMDFLKSNAPFWKKENDNGEGEWVQSRDTDAQALCRWSV
jgi:molybdopterin synthase catalytic subunit